jgi:hypothetical protein
MDVHAYSSKGSDLRSQTEGRPMGVQMNMDTSMNKATEIKSENWHVIWMNDENYTFIVVDKIDYSLATVQFLRFNKQDFDVDVYKKKHNGRIGSSATDYIHGLIGDHTKFTYVDIPEDFLIFNTNKVETHEVITDTDVITQQKYKIIPPDNHKMYRLIWKQNPSTRENGNYERKPDGFTFMYKNEPFFSMTNVIKDVWGCTNINKENWSFGKY